MTHYVFSLLMYRYKFRNRSSPSILRVKPG